MFHNQGHLLLTSARLSAIYYIVMECCRLLPVHFILS